MSFILDALKKSESERQEQSGAEFSRVPNSAEEGNPLRWLWLLAALLLINVAVLLGILLRPGDDASVQPVAEVTTPAPVAPSIAAPAAIVEKATPSFEEQVASAVIERPAVSQVPPADPQPPSADKAGPRLPTLDQLRLAGSVNLPELHLDIHVYSDAPAERFVFINMNKYREGARIEAGPEVREISPEGVILEHQGQAFLLPRE
ncbi:MAG: general secretion pathway protein GspB [Gammaproteobacteria bacterium]|nr:general secretion pathway protein GspB [Gammaproteobacteria bacterium]MDH5303163.1 general secretion pathway protein GspB [Gammaproteobacteria bacterium]MDH5320829.1 general secretion pathway protein GspB [Gammaproteobacteria bacterium]